MTLVAPAPPRLTRLELQGFKSFANRTMFIFDPGITAVIGPNGSGKSNISDGVRWVLGETSHSLLRSRKTEDVIFAGGRGKSPSGMAEVTVTFDNATGWLPIEFTEVSVTRRAFRTGENHFLINGRKARLKDIQQLTASLGHSYTVVGQGLVDAALSQRPEERRGLFEHAADLTGLQLKVNEAERNLADAETNAERINDLLADVAPRLRTLERAAKQAREWQGVHDRLRLLEQGYYRQALLTLYESLHSAEHAAERNAAEAEVVRTRVEALSTELREARIDAEETQAIVERHRANLETVTDQLRRIGHERELTQERLAALDRRRADMADSQHGLDEQLETVAANLGLIDQELATATKDRSAAAQNVAELRRQVQRGRDARLARERQIASLASGAQTIERQLSDAHRRWSLVEQRQQTGAVERDQALATAAERDQRIIQLESQLAALIDADAKSERQQATVSKAIETLSADLEDARASADGARDRLTALTRSRDEAAARLHALQRIQESGAGLYAGVKAVLEDARNDRLQGVRGPVAELIRVPKQLDTAIEVALGAHLQDVVVERWVDAERAIERLKATGSGRATFQPIDAVRSMRQSQVDQKLTARSGVHGVASMLIEAPADVLTIITSLIGRTLVVENLQVAREVLSDLPVGWSAVTLAGEIVRAGGSLTGGSAVRESGVLGRERELRELPLQIARADADLEAARKEQGAIAEMLDRLLEERRQRENAQSALLATRRERSAQITQLRGWLGGLVRERQIAEEQSAKNRIATENSTREIASLEEEIARLQEKLAEAGASQESLAERAASDLGHLSELEQRLTAEERLLAGLEERVRATERQKTGLTAQLTGLQQEASMRSDRASAIAG
ncbi:MAG: chromosome segregation SMC family protein [Thermomicrobiales bacterium]